MGVIIKTKEEIEAAQQQAQQQAMMAQFGPEMVRQVGGVIQKGMQNGQASSNPSAG